MTLEVSVSTAESTIRASILPEPAMLPLHSLAIGKAEALLAYTYCLRGLERPLLG